MTPSTALRSYPAFLRLEGRRAVIVGAGAVAASKLEGLLAAGALVRVVAPSVRAELRRREVEIRERPFRARDLDDAWFVVAAAPPAVNRRVVRAATARRVFVNAVDDAATATAFLGGVVRRGAITVATSTGGAAPALAGLLREALEALLPDEAAEWVGLAEKLRSEWRSGGVAHAHRRRLLFEALSARYGPGPDPPAFEGVDTLGGTA